MTNEEVNIALAKWHSKQDEKYVWMVETSRSEMVGINRFQRAGLHCCAKYALYTESLDTMRMIEKLFTAQQEHDYCLETTKGRDIGDWYAWVTLIFVDAETRARAAVTALGLGSETE